MSPRIDDFTVLTSEHGILYSSASNIIHGNGSVVLTELEREVSGRAVQRSQRARTLPQPSSDRQPTANKASRPAQTGSVHGKRGLAHNQPVRAPTAVDSNGRAVCS